MADVAQHVGVSRALVSIVFRGVDGASEATRRAGARSGRRAGLPARLAGPGPAPQPHAATSACCSRCADPSRSSSSSTCTRCRELGYHLLLGPFTPGRGQDAVVDELLGYRCEGLVVVGPELHGRDLEPIAEEVAVVEVGRGVTRGPVDVVRNDDAVGTRQAVDHLVASGTARSPTSTGATTRGRGTGVLGTAWQWATTVWAPRSGWSPGATPRTRGRAPPAACWPTGCPPPWSPPTTRAPSAYSTS